MKQFLKIVFILISTLSHAQTDTGHVGNIKTYLGKVFTTREISSLSKHYDSLNNSHIGEEYVPFILNTNTGEALTNENVKGKVLFIAFFYETCNCWNYQNLNEFYNAMKDEQDFLFVAVTSEGNMLDEFIKNEHINFPIARVSYIEDQRRLNYNNGLPSFVIINKEGKVACIKNSDIGTKRPIGGYVDLLKLCNYTTDLLTRQE
jgi:hypothetical protein